MGRDDRLPRRGLFKNWFAPGGSCGNEDGDEGQDRAMAHHAFGRDPRGKAASVEK